MRRLKIGIGVILVMLIGCAICLFLLRNSLLQSVFKRNQAKVKSRYGIELSLKNLQFISLNTIVFKDVVLKPLERDTLLKIDSGAVKVSLLKILLGDIKLNDVTLNGVRLNVINFNDNSNIKFSSIVKDTSSNARLATEPLYTRVMNRLNGIAGIALKMRHVEMSYTDSSVHEKVVIPILNLDKESVYAVVYDSINTDSLVVKGNVNFKGRNADLNIGSDNPHVIFNLPFIRVADGLQCAFNSVGVKLQWEQSDEQLNLKADITAHNFQIEHWRLASERVIFPSIGFRGEVSATSKSLMLDSNSVLQLQSLPVKLFCYFEKHDTNIIAALKIDIADVEADTFFNCLPQGVFQTLKGISCRGKLGYHLKFHVDTKRLDSLVFESSMPSKGLALSHYGKENYGRINEEFVYDAYVKDVKVRELLVGHSNPHFVSLRQIHPFLIQSVLHSEDPSFMRHNGFLESAFRESFIQNIREKRFARGGSTISMQLVKNIYLNRDKNIARKLEEAMIVYLIENLNLVSKERMLEVYLNIIEWGPGVYGIGEASSFYFKKKPSELSLQESIFLAGIIPNPRVFKYHFAKDGLLRSHFIRYYQVLSNRMVAKNVINPSDTVGVFKPLELKGDAKQFVSPLDGNIEFSEENEMLLPAAQ